jgi:N-terminal acetyltransferase 2
MLGRFLSRLPLLRAFLPRISSPILPLTSRIPIYRPYTFLPRSRLFNPIFPRRAPSFSTAPPRPPSANTQLPENPTLSQRLRHLVRTYGWYALGMYAVLTVVDFGVVFAGINLLGAQQVSKWASSVRSTVSGVIGTKPPDPGQEEIEHAGGHGGGHEGLYAMLVLAYTIHKTLLLPVRIGLTAFLTPKFVAFLSARGWVGGEGARRAAQEMRERISRRKSG